MSDLQQQTKHNKDTCATDNEYEIRTMDQVMLLAQSLVEDCGLIVQISRGQSAGDVAVVEVFDEHANMVTVLLKVTSSGERRLVMNGVNEVTPDISNLYMMVARCMKDQGFD
jgi:hypothetical protein